MGDYICKLGDYGKVRTKFSKELIDIMNKKCQKYNSFFRIQKGLDNLFVNIKLRLLYLTNYNETYLFIKNYKKPLLNPTAHTKNVKILLEEFENICERVILNNILLAYGYLTEKYKLSFLVDKEDEKLMALKKLYKKEITIKKFKKDFGHYGFSPFELSSPRYCDYNKEKLVGMGHYLKKFKLSKKIRIEDYINCKKKNLFAVYSFLREELRYILLVILRDLRREMLQIEREKKTGNIFDLSYKKILSMNNEKI